MDEFSGKDEAFVEQWLLRQELEKLVNVLKGMFSRFWIFLHLLEIFNVKNKILRNKYNQKQQEKMRSLGSN